MSYPLITLYTPGIKLELATKAQKYNPDSIIIDLEDTVPPDLKISVRHDVAPTTPVGEPPRRATNHGMSLLLLQS